MNISSVVITVKPKDLKQVLQSLDEKALCEVHLHDTSGKIVVTLEGENSGEEVNKLKHIQAIQGVLSAEMVYAFSEEELEADRDKVEKKSGPPGWLNDDNVKAEDIRYGGHPGGKK